MIVNGLHNLAVDHEVLNTYLNLRAIVHGSTGRLQPAQFMDPVPPYPLIPTSQATAAAHMLQIADNSALFVQHLGGTPESPASLANTPNDADLLRLIIDWGTVQSGIQKTILRLYGLEPCPPAGLPN